jgi:hypothetical protein
MSQGRSREETVEIPIVSSVAYGTYITYSPCAFASPVAESNALSSPNSE